MSEKFKARGHPTFRFTTPSGERVSPTPTTKYEEFSARGRMLLAVGHTATCNFPEPGGQLTLIHRLYNKISPAPERIEPEELVPALEAAQADEQAVLTDGSWQLGPRAVEALDDFIAKPLWTPKN